MKIFIDGEGNVRQENGDFSQRFKSNGRIEIINGEAEITVRPVRDSNFALQLGEKIFKVDTTTCEIVEQQPR